MKKNSAKEALIVRKISEMQKMSEMHINGHYVERYGDGFWVDHKGPMGFEDAIDKVYPTINEIPMTGVPCDI